MPTSGTPAASTALPQPPSTSHIVPRNSAAIFLELSMMVPSRSPYPAAGHLPLSIPFHGAAKQNGAGSLPRRSLDQKFVDLDELQIDGLRATLVGFDFEADILAFVQAAQAGGLDSGDMNEHVLAAVLRRDESETLRRVEELNLTDHYGFLLKAFEAIARTPRPAQSS